MIYRSNLSAPNLETHFAATTICKPRPWSMGHSVMSDADYDPDCCFLTHDEAAILTWCARPFLSQPWGDIGARFGWTSKHINWVTNAPVICVDPHFNVPRLAQRFKQNTGFPTAWMRYCTAEQFLQSFSAPGPYFGGFMIDGDHDSPQPLNDARGALSHLAPTGVIVFHDFWGKPIRDAAQYLIDQGMGCRTYDTPAGMAVCWRGDFAPPDHVPDPAIDWAQVRRSRAPEFDFERCK